MTHHRHQHPSSPWQELFSSLQETLKELFSKHPQFQYDGKTYTVRASGRRALELLRDWKEVIRDEETSSLTLRNEIQCVVSSPPPILLAHLLKRAGDPMTVRLILLIVRRGRVHAATKAVLSRYEDSDQRVRRDVVRTLRRLSAWRELRIVANQCDFDDTRQFAAIAETAPFEKRLQNFANRVRIQPHETEDQELVVSSAADFSGGRPARSGIQISRVLRSIRHLIRRAQARRRRLRCKPKSS